MGGLRALRRGRGGKERPFGCDGKEMVDHIGPHECIPFIWDTLQWGENVMAAATLLPIVPILLLPFILIFFVAVFPLWLVSLGVLGLLLLIMRGLGKLGQLAGTEVLNRAAVQMHRAFRWVLTFGGLARSANESSRAT